MPSPGECPRGRAARHAGHPKTASSFTASDLQKRPHVRVRSSDRTRLEGCADFGQSWRRSAARYENSRRRIGVVVPVHDEEQALPRCLDGLEVAISGVAVPVTVIVLLDACHDGSAAVVNGFCGRGVEAIVVQARSVGVARAAGMAEVLAHHGELGTWLATTDGDSVVPPHWLVAQLRHASAGARVVAGTVAVAEWGDRSPAVRDRARRAYRAVPHRHIHGANMSFGAIAYRAAGGFPPVSHDEDVALVDAFRANAEPITWATDIPVLTSARRHARAPKGLRVTCPR
jgi:Glycosyl transferase family 2